LEKPRWAEVLVALWWNFATHLPVGTTAANSRQTLNIAGNFKKAPAQADPFL
jgi:hypothetical protein